MKACLPTNQCTFQRIPKLLTRLIQQYEKSTPDIFLFITVIISLLATPLTVHLLCKTKKLRALLASLVLHQVKEVGAVIQKEINTEYKTSTYISLFLTILGVVMVAFCIIENQIYAEDACSLM